MSGENAIPSLRPARTISQKPEWSPNNHAPFPGELASAVHILVVDDEPEIANSLAELLNKKEGYRVSIARDGLEATKILERSMEQITDLVDLVLLDVRMPVMAGPELLAWLRKHPTLRYTRVIMLTAASGSDEKIQALSAGADDYITKPYSPLELLARVKTILRTQQLEKQLQRQSRQLRMLNKVGRQVAACLSSKDILAEAVKGAWEVLGVECTAAFMTGSEQSRLHCQQVYPLDGPLQPKDFNPINTSLGSIGLVYRNGKGLSLNNVAKDGSFRIGEDAPEEFPVNSLMAAPFMVRGRPVGVIAVYNKLSGDFSGVDNGLLSSLASSTSRALEIAWLFQNVRQRQKELLESRNLLQAVIDGILHPIYTIDKEWKVVAVNQTKAVQLQMSDEAIVGRHCFQVFFQRKSPCEHCQVEAIVDRSQSQGWSVQWEGDDHVPQEWDVSAYPVPGSTAGAAQTVVVWQDRTEERRLESSLIQAAKLTAIGQLAAGVAHEINNPLTVIQANAEMLQMAVAAEDEIYESIDLIAQAGERATRVVRGLLDFARERRYEFVTANINQSIEQALSLVAYQFKNNEIMISTRLAENLPQVSASWEHLQTVWLNLLINARDAVRERTSDRRIEIASRYNAVHQEILVFVRDNGRGITPGQLTHIFEPFYTTKAPGTGTGLGLATSHQIIERHNGQIEVVSTPGEGSTFVIHVPVSNEDNKTASG